MGHSESIEKRKLLLKRLSAFNKGFSHKANLKKRDFDRVEGFLSAFQCSGDSNKRPEQELAVGRKDGDL